MVVGVPFAACAGPAGRGCAVRRAGAAGCGTVCVFFARTGNGCRPGDRAGARGACRKPVRVYSLQFRKVEALIARIVASPSRSACILAARGDDLAGILWCSVGEYHIGSDILLATIHNLNVQKSLRATLAAAG